MKKMLSILLVLSILSFLFVSHYYSSKTTIPSKDIDSVLSMLVDDTSGVAWLNQVNINLNSLSPAYGIELDHSNITITKGGNYILSGALPNGSITVNTSDKVNLTFNNASITNLSGPALNIVQSSEAYITLMTNTVNFLTDGTAYSSASNSPGAITSCNPLIFQGNGGLQIVSGSENGIYTTAPVSVHQGAIKITAAKSGILAQDKVNLLGGHLSLAVADNGIDTTDEIIINDGGIDLTAAHIALRAAKNFIINGGTLNILDSTIGIQSSSNIIINKGNVNITAIQSGMHSGGSITINNGNLHISGKDGALSASHHITINDGTILAFATVSHEALSCLDNGLSINGGTLVALGSYDMLPNSKTSRQTSVLLGSGDAHQPVSITHNNTHILTFMPDQPYEHLLFSSPDLTQNASYTLRTGGFIAKSENFYGLYNKGTTVDAKLLGTFSLTEQVTDLTSNFPRLSLQSSAKQLID